MQQLNFLPDLGDSADTEETDRRKDSTPSVPAVPQNRPHEANVTDMTAATVRDVFIAELESGLLSRYRLDVDNGRIELLRGKAWHPICGLIRVSNIIRQGTERFAKLEFINDAGELCTRIVPILELLDRSGNIASDLLNLGLQIYGTSRDLQALLRSFETPCIEEAPPQPGWGDGITPDFGLGPNGQRRITAESTAEIDHDSLNLWQQDFARYLSGNPHALFVICVAFVGPLLKLAGHDPVGFHINGTSSDAKSITMQCAADLMSTKIIDWNATDAALRMASVQMNHQLIALDESHRISAQDMQFKIYTMLNGRERLLKSTGACPDGKGWRVCYLSTGEDSLENHLSKGGQLRAGHLTRFIDLPEATEGLWPCESRRKFESYNFIRARAAVSSAHGPAAGFAFLARLVAELPVYQETTKVWLEEERLSLVDALSAHDEENLVQRVLSNFAVVALAGRLAVTLGILPQNEQEVREAVHFLAQGWLANRIESAGPGKSEAARVKRQFVEFIAAKGAAGCLCLAEARANPRRVAKYGWQDDDFLYLLPAALDAAIADQTSSRRAARYLNEAGLILSGGGAQSLQYKLSVNGSRPNVYRICKQALSSA